MPILATLITVHLLGGDDDAPALLAPTELRERAENVLTDADTRTRVIALIDEYVRLTEQYNASADTALDEYRSRTLDFRHGSEDLLAVLQPLNDQRLEILERLIGLREKLLNIVSEDEWRRLLA